MSQPSPAKDKPRPPASGAATDRRGFLTSVWALALGAVALIVPTASGLVVFFDPLRRKGGQDSLIPVAPLEALPDDGIPRQFPVVADRIDAWNRSREPIGAVYLRRAPGQAQVQCLTATCPHAGCFVNYDAAANIFRCPCHNSSFTVDGARIEPSPSPRPMDTLECEVAKQEVLVKFESFYSGTSEKVAKG
jgi:menaquinol-cytochrome c reductase iron-sulfur subunit